MIQINNLTKRFKNETLYEGVSLKIELGNKIILEGPNGSGKSVFLKLLSGLSKPNEGEIIYEEGVLCKDFDFSPSTGLSINQPDFLNNLTGMENLLFLANIKKIATKDDIMQFAKQLHFDRDINKKYKNYSLGMKQKLRFIQALMDKPRYVFLDEPFESVDSKSKKVMYQILNDYIDKDRLLIYISHNSEDKKLADQILEIDYDDKIISYQ